MTDNNNIFIKKSCRTCMVIRLFIIAILILLIVSILAKDQMHNLSFITAWKVAAGIWIFGIISFVVKVIFWRKEERKGVNDPSLND